MRLINTTTFELHEFLGEDIPQYAILSHTWRDGEVIFADYTHWTAEELRAHPKIGGTCAEARRHELEYVWVDTVCIDKSSSAELSEAINSMFNWYRDSEICFVYLDDVDSLDELKESRWITRGWTLQELIAPHSVVLYSKFWRSFGSKILLADRLASVTNIDRVVFMERASLESFNIATRMSWAAMRTTKRAEDRAYCLMGIFDVNMPILYGEGAQKAFNRLQDSILGMSDDHSILAWNRFPPVPPKTLDLPKQSDFDCLAPDPWYFNNRRRIITVSPESSTITVTKQGLKVSLPMLYDQDIDEGHVILNCRFEGFPDGQIALPIQVLARRGDYAVPNIKSRESRLVSIRSEQLKEAEFESVCLLRYRPSIFKDEAPIKTTRHICCVRAMSLLNRGYEVIHARAKYRMQNWDPRTLCAEIVALGYNPQVSWKFGFFHRAQNEAFVVSFRDGREEAVLSVESKPLGADGLTWLMSKGVYYATTPSLAAQDQFKVVQEHEQQLELDFGSAENIAESKTIELHSDASVAFATAGVKYHRSLKLDAHFYTLELSLRCLHRKSTYFTLLRKSSSP
jgi:hypothetical protein